MDEDSTAARYEKSRIRRFLFVILIASPCIAIPNLEGGANTASLIERKMSFGNPRFNSMYQGKHALGDGDLMCKYN